MTIWCNDTLMIRAEAPFVYGHGKGRITSTRRGCYTAKRQSWSPLKGSVLGDLHYYVADRRIFDPTLM